MKTDLKAVIKNLAGEEVEYNFVALRRKEAMRVFHNSLTSILGAIGEVSDLTDTSIFRALKSIEFDVVWDLAESLLNQVIIDGTEITDINETDYFNDKQDEFYLAIGYALKLNYPDIFTKAQAAIKKAMGKQNEDSALLDLARKARVTV